MNANQGQKAQILNHLKLFGSITSWEAIEKYHITRLSEYIRSLRNDDGLRITDAWKEKDGKHWKEYYLSTNDGQLSFA